MNGMGLLVLTIAVSFTYTAAFLILKKRKYFFVTGMRTRPEEEIKKLEKTGFLRATGRLYLATGIILSIGLIAMMAGISYAFEISVGIFLIVFVIGYIYIQKYELKERRQSAYLSSAITAFITIGIVGYILGRGFIANDLIINEEQIEITGPYGIEFKIEEIQEIELIEDIPEINLRTNGYAFGERLIGNFDLEEYGGGKLYIHGENKPYLLIDLNETYFIINSKDSTETERWYNEITKKLQ
ncbi:DUF3784 domain-containing protein [Oceanobacillus halophilus]|uniref:DUF3784 domain-containing protein n=1 Tax=Oceanobacillus halophilus TaxID=930130 RepID=A0A495A3A7_9BACI|nr:DUF3784 domain-containing protein [Oceanobacillus halophilus]RKQ33448.1 DUF3784 domain-containing protein [Oceanobacillus halophilus]